MPTPHVRWVLVPIVLLTAGLTGCGLSFDQEEIRLRVRPDQDRLDALFIYQGAAPSDSTRNSFEESVKTASAVMDGLRVFPLLGPIVFDLEEPGDDLTPEQADIMGCIHVDQAGAFLDESGRLCLYQHAHIERLGFVIDTLNRGLSEAMLAHDMEQPEDNDLDPRTHALWLAKARSHEPWIRLAGETIEFDIPLSAESKDRALKSLFDGLNQPGGKELTDWLLQVAGSIDSLSWSDERLVARLGTANRGLLNVTLKSNRKEPGQPADSLLEALADSNHLPDTQRTIADVRSLLADPD